MGRLILNGSVKIRHRLGNQTVPFSFRALSLAIDDGCSSFPEL
jgi:hypothetical protein